MKITDDIKKAILQNRGGLETASDAALMQLWLSLSIDTQLEYINTIKKEKRDADTVRSKQ